jgi:hypothetical protein
VRSRAASAAAIVSLALIAAACLVLGLDRERHQLASNLVRPVAIVAAVEPGERLCQRGVTVPAGTGALGLRLGAFDGRGPALRVTIRASGRPDLRGTLPAGWGTGYVSVPVDTVGVERRAARVCLEHDGPGRVAVAGDGGAVPVATLGADRMAGAIRVEFAEPEPRSWFATIPDLADRLAVARDALPGSAALPLAALLALAVLGGSVALVVREGRR